MKKRIMWVDIAKGIAMLTVFAVHSWPGSSPVNIALISFNIPLFFILSGYTMRMAETKEGFLTNLKKYAKHILLPALIMLGAADALKILTGSEALTPGFILWQYVFMPGKGIFVIWFVFALFNAKVICDAVNVIFKKEHRSVILSALLLLAIVLAHHDVLLPLNFGAAAAAAWFIYAGHLFREHETTLRKFAGPAFFFALIFWYWANTQEFYLNIALMEYKAGFVSVIEALAGSLVVIEIARAIEDLPHVSKALAYVGRNTLLIYYLHAMDFLFIRYWMIPGASPEEICLRRMICAAVPFVTIKLCGFIVKNIRSLRRPETVSQA